MPPVALDAPFPEPFLGQTPSARKVLLHLYSHLSYHLGQVDYLRRMITGDGAIELVVW